MKLLFRDENGGWKDAGTAKGRTQFKVQYNGGAEVAKFERENTGKVHQLKNLNDVLANQAFDSLCDFLTTEQWLQFVLIGKHGNAHNTQIPSVIENHAPIILRTVSKLYFFRDNDRENTVPLRVGNETLEVCSLYAASGEENKEVVFLKTKNGEYWCKIEDLASNWNGRNENKSESKAIGAVDMVEVTSLNTIFYGPPGTGKTYSLKEAVARLFGKDPEDYLNFKALMDAFPKQIEFLTFHQSYSYEDFIEGITAKTNNEGDIKYVIKNGVFKAFCRRAYVYKKLAENGLTENEIEQYSDAIELYAQSTDEQLVESNNISELRELLDNASTGAHKQSKDARKFVICIDEINRGNISKIFGELITLIEDTKRYGAKDVISATLAGSGDQLHVPDNLYIIGTMNTADRSIAKLDVALRRRFDFFPMYPKTGLIEDDKVRTFLVLLNKAIFDKKSSHELAVGHAFFIGVKSAGLRRVLKNKVIPLLEEYLMENRDEVCAVLRQALPGKNVDFDDRTFSYTIDGKKL